MSALGPKADMCGATGDVGYGPIADIRPKFLSAYKLKEGRQSRRPDLLFCFPLFYSFLCRINTCGNLLPAITVPDITAADNRVGRSESHPITFGGLVVIPTRLRHEIVLFSGVQMTWGPHPHGLLTARLK